jgi:hypothetical protein
MAGPWRTRLSVVLAGLMAAAVFAAGSRAAAVSRRTATGAKTGTIGGQTSSVLAAGGRASCTPSSPDICAYCTPMTLFVSSAGAGGQRHLRQRGRGLPADELERDAGLSRGVR